MFTTPSFLVLPALSFPGFDLPFAFSPAGPGIFSTGPLISFSILNQLIHNVFQKVRLTFSVPMHRFIRKKITFVPAWVFRCLFWVAG